MSQPKSTKRARSTLERSLSLFDEMPRRKPIKRAKTAAEEKYFDNTPGLEDLGVVRTLGNATSAAQALDTSSFVQANMFEPIPERAAGMNGSRVAEVLNFRKNLPPILSAAHLHALSPSPSSAERGISSAVQVGALRRITIPGRGSGVSSVSDLLVSMEDMRSFMLRSRVKEVTRETYLHWLDANRSAITMPADALKADQIVELVKAGFLTTASASSSIPLAGPSTAADVGTATSISVVASAAAGSAEATGGHGATLGAGGGGAGVLQRSLQSRVQYQVAMPNTGPYLKLIIAARTHIVDLLKKSNRRELPLYLLHEYWEAGLSSKSTVAEASKKPFEKLLPGQTKKWKAFYGLKFDFALQEAFGAGMVECFNTRAVGLGVRAT